MWRALLHESSLAGRGKGKRTGSVRGGGWGKMEINEWRRSLKGRWGWGRRVEEKRSLCDEGTGEGGESCAVVVAAAWWSRNKKEFERKLESKCWKEVIRKRKKSVWEGGREYTKMLSTPPRMASYVLFLFFRHFLFTVSKTLSLLSKSFPWKNSFFLYLCSPPIQLPARLRIRNCKF